MYYKCNKKSEKIKNSKNIPDDDEIKIFQNSLSNIINDKMKILSILKNVKKEGNGESKENLQANYIEKLSQRGEQNQLPPLSLFYYRMKN